MPKSGPRRWRVVLTAGRSTLVIVNGDTQHNTTTIDASSRSLSLKAIEDAEMTQLPTSTGKIALEVAPPSPP